MKRLNRYGWLFLFLFHPLWLQAAPTESNLSQESVITAGLVSNFPPQYSLDKDGNPQGFAIDTMNAIAPIAGLTVKYKVYDNWSDISEALTSGEINLIPNNGITEARRQYSDFTHPLETFAISVFVRKESVGLKTLSDIQDVTIGVVESNAAVRFLRNKQHKIQIYPSFSDLLLDLVSGRIDAVAYPTPVVWRIAQEAGLDHRIRSIEPALIEIKRGMALAKGQQELLAKLNDGISQFLHSDRYETIYTKWFAKPKPYWNPERVLTAISVIIIALIIGAVWWRNISLRRINIQLEIETRLRDKAEIKLQQLNTELEEKVVQRTSELAQSNEILNCIDHLREQFIKDADPRILFPELLDSLLKLTESEHGMVGDVLVDEAGARYLKIYAISNLAWNDDMAHLYKQLLNDGIEFRNLDNLFGLAVTSEKPVISNDPLNDSRRAGLPKGHPVLNSFMSIPVFFGDKLVGQIGLANRKGGYDQSIFDELRPVVAALGQIIVARWDKKARLEAETELKSLALTDPLTGAANRRSFESRLAEEISRTSRYQEPLTLMMLDIDHFKLINDEFGHETGDKILIELVEQFRLQLRETDFLARWGGEEFTIILPRTSIETGQILAERLRQKIESHSFSNNLDLTVSMGLASYLANEELGSLVSRADYALYDAKNAGRNRVVQAG